MRFTVIEATYRRHATPILISEPFMHQIHYNPSRHSFMRHGLFLAALLVSLAAGTVHAGTFNNFLGMKFVDIAAGSFEMGSCQVASAVAEDNKRRAMIGKAPLTANCSAPDLDALNNEVPQRSVNISGFQMGVTEVTLGQFKKYIIATDGVETDLVTDDFMKFNAYKDDAPAVHVSWNEAKNFIVWLNKNKPATDRGTYRLASEAEWEYACRAGTNHTYCGSRSVNAVAWFKGNSGNHQQPVGKKEANAFGLHDMSGNIWEWVEDCYHDDYLGAPANGSAWTETCSSSGRVLRGGSWKGDAKNQRVANRMGSAAVSRSNYIGFRLVRMLP
jgi:formylglycine-generating enzyme required for sulfatase activity